MPFERFNRGLAAESEPLTVAIQQKGIIAMNGAAFRALGEPKAVVLLFDRERQIVALQAADPADEDSVMVRPNAKGSTHLVTGTLFTRHYNIKTTVGRRWSAFMDGALLCINTSEAPLRTQVAVSSAASRSLSPPSPGGRPRNPGRGSS